VSMSGEKSGVKSEGNQTGADRTSLSGYAVRHPCFEQGLTCFAESPALTLAALQHRAP
jgi:hypothetical protein